MTRPLRLLRPPRVRMITMLRLLTVLALAWGLFLAPVLGVHVGLGPSHNTVQADDDKKGKDDQEDEDKSKDGEDGKNGKDGENGQEGTAGKDGADGKDGKDVQVRVTGAVERQPAALTATGGDQVAPSVDYRVTVTCAADQPATGQTTCTFTGVAQGRVPSVRRVVVPADALCAAAVGGTYASIMPDPTTRITGFASKDGDTLSLVLAGTVSVSGTGSYWVETRNGLAPAAGPGLTCTAGETPASFAIFALHDDCSGGGTALSWSGSSGRIDGQVHSNGGLALSGSRNAITGAVTYACEGEARVTGSGNSFGAGPTQGATQPPPARFAAADFDCDFTPPDGDLGQDGAWWENGDRSSRHLRDGVYCTTGRLSLTGSGISGNVTFVAMGAEGQIRITGSRFNLTPFTKNVLLYAEADATDAVALSGSSGTWGGIVYAPNGEVGVSGSSITSAGGLIVADTIKLAGSNWAIKGMASPVPDDISDSTGAIRVQATLCDVGTPPSDFDWFGECTRPVTGTPFTIALWDGTKFVPKETAQADSEGIASFSRLQPGTYELKQSGTTWCHAESDSVDAKGQVIVKAGQRSSVWIFNCASEATK